MKTLKFLFKLKPFRALSPGYDVRDIGRRRRRKKMPQLTETGSDKL